MVDARTLVDVLGCVRALAGFALVMMPPGYVAGRVCGIPGWRPAEQQERLLWSVALSFAVVPIAAVLLVKYPGWRWALAGLLICWVAAGSQMLSTRRTGERRPLRWIWWLAASGWSAFSIAELIDVSTPGHLYLSSTIFDHALRTAFVDAVMRTGVPPANPLFWPGHPAAMRYYYFWYVVVASVAKLTGTTARQAMIASVTWAGFGLAAAIGLYGRRFLPSAAGKKHTRLIVGVALLGVAGLDLLPTVAKLLTHVPADADIDWWAPDQVTTWLGTLLWVPHHLAGLVCCVTGFLLVWISATEPLERRLRCGALAGMAFASSFGLSIWVAIAFALSFCGWGIWAWWREQTSRPRVKMLAGAGVVSAVLLLPYLGELRGAPSGVETGASAGADTQASAGLLLRFGVRRMIDDEPMRALPGFANLAKTHPRLEEAIADLLLLVPGYFAELGFWSVVLFAMLRARRLDDAERSARALAIAGLFVTTFLRSTVVTNNDFGMRSALVVQFFGLLFGIRWMEGALGPRGKGIRRFAWALLWIGAASTGYEAVLLRVYLPAQERVGNRGMAGLSVYAAAMRDALTTMDARVDKAAVVQFDPDQPSDYFRYADVVLARRQLGSGFPSCTADFGGDPRDCKRVEAGAGALFAASGGVGISAGEARALCAGLGTTTLVATRWDDVWHDPRSWVWNLPKVVGTEYVRVVNCGRQAG